MAKILDSFIQQCFTNLSIGAGKEVGIAREYLVDRNILKPDVAIHRVGYCHERVRIPDEIRYFRRNKKVSVKDYSYFIGGKIIVPIFGEFGEIVGFATRPPSSGEGNTWWNTSFKKGNSLFLLDKSRKHIFDENKVYIVEGYMDAFIAYKYGLKNVVGLMGTALTYRKIGLIARYTNNVCLCLDSDENMAGQNARDKSIYFLKKFDFCENISVINLPINHDPDEYISMHGMDSFLSLEHTLTDSEINDICLKTHSRI